MEQNQSEAHQVMRGKVNVYKRENSDAWQCSTYLNGRNWRVSTKTENLPQAKEFAEDWYIELKGKSQAGVLKTGRTFQEASDKFLEEYPIITEGERSPKGTKLKELKLKAIINPYLGEKVLSEITAGTDTRLPLAPR